MSANKATERRADELFGAATQRASLGIVSRISGWVEAHARILLIAGITLYIAVFAAAACYKYWAYWMGFDLAVHLQVLWNTAHGRIAASSPSAGTASYFGIDIIITELLLAPLYRLIPSVYMLLTLQTIVLALGAVPVYLFARDRLRTPLAGLAFAAAYLLYAPVEWMNLYEFQIRAFATTFLLCALYALHRRRSGWFWFWSLLALGCRSDVGLVLAGIGVMTLLEVVRGQRSEVKGWKRVITFGIAPIVVGLGWMLLCVLVLVPSFRTDGQFLYTKVIYGWLGDTPGAMLRRLLTDPGYVLGYVFGSPDGSKRLRYLLEMFLPFAFLPLLAPRRILPALPIFALNLLSNTPQLHASTHYHYQALVIPFMLTAAVDGFDWLKQRVEGKQHYDASATYTGRLFRTILSCSLVFVVAFVCNIGFRNPFFNLLTRPIDYERNSAAAEMLLLIPPNASVAATSSLGPRLAHREQLYVFPGDDIIYPVAYSQRAEYLIVDTYPPEFDADDRAYYDRLRASSQYHLIGHRIYFYRGQEQDISVWQKTP